MNTKLKNFISSSSFNTESTFVCTELKFGLMRGKTQLIALFVIEKAYSLWAIGIRQTQLQASANVNWKEGFYGLEFPNV